MNTQIILSENSSDFTTFLDPAIEFDDNMNYEAALAHLETYNSIPNITETNNVFQYSTDKGLSWKSIYLPTDAYEYDQIAAEIQRQMVINGDCDTTNENDINFYITFGIIRLSSVIEIKHESYKVNFDCENSIGYTLGFNKETLGLGTHKSPNIVQITSINSLLVNVDFISGTYVNNKKSSTLYSFYPKVAPGYKIITEPNHLFYLPVTAKKLNSIRLWITDQNGKVINLQGEILTVTIYIREKSGK